MRLKELREDKKLSQSSVAVEIGTNQRNISRWEKGENEPTTGFLIKLADYFDCSIDYLVGREDDFGHITVVSKRAPLSAEEFELVALFRSLSKEWRTRLFAYAKKASELERLEIKK